jgi:hypothetical protein
MGQILKIRQLPSLRQSQLFEANTEKEACHQNQ